MRTSGSTADSPGWLQSSWIVPSGFGSRLHSAKSAPILENESLRLHPPELCSCGRQWQRDILRVVRQRDRGDRLPIGRRELQALLNLVWVADITMNSHQKVR